MSQDDTWAASARDYHANRRQRLNGSTALQSPDEGALEVVCAGNVKSRAIDWLWLNWIAIGKVSVIAGDGGKGKSTILCDLAARATTGEPWPDKAPACDPADVIILSAEDDPEDTLKPRLVAAGADVWRVHIVRAVKLETGSRRTFSLQADMAKLEEVIQATPNAKLVIIDPISSYLGKVDSHKNAEVRSVLEPLGEMAARLGVAVICNNHFSKGGGNANSRVIGSVAFVNQARAAFIVTDDAENKVRKLLMPSKMNIAPIKYGLAYMIEGVHIETDGIEVFTSRILWDATPVTITADEALAAHEEAASKTEKAEATEFLREVLASGTIPAVDVKREATAAGISSKALRTAKEALGIRPERTGFGAKGSWAWKLPEMPKMPSSSIGAHVPERASMGSWASMERKDGPSENSPLMPSMSIDAQAGTGAPMTPKAGTYGGDDLDIPPYLRREPPTAADAPAISSGPDDRLEDLQ